MKIKVEVSNGPITVDHVDSYFVNEQGLLTVVHENSDELTLFAAGCWERVQKIADGAE